MALSVDTPRSFEIGDYTDYPVKASTKIYDGALVGDDGSGYARGLVAGDPFLGIAIGQADNSAVATDGAINVKVRTGIFRAQMTLASVAITDKGKDVYASADDTLTLTESTNTPVGRVHRYVSANTCIVEFNALHGSDVLNHQHTAATNGGALTSPRVVTAICDTNGNELAKVTATTSAVNEITLANAATGNGPTIIASGETNVPLTISAKGTGLLTLGQATGSVQIGTVATDTIGLYGTTPTAKQAHITDAAGADAGTGSGTVDLTVLNAALASHLAKINAILVALETIGIVKTS